jgi:endonuclease/exonuclease/phosphatase (EEP) superfamily protein YafD
MQTLGPTSPIVPILLRSIISTSGLLNKEQLMAQLDQMSQPDPQMQEMQNQQAQLQMSLVQAQANELNARAEESAADAQEAQARAQKLLVEASLMDEKVKSDIIRNLSANISANDDNEFQKRAKLAELFLKEKDIDTKERIVDKQMMEKRMNNA